MKLTRLVGEIPHQLLRQNARVARHIEDVFLRVQRGELAAKLGQGINDLGRGTAHAGVKQGKQPSGAAADDGQVAKGMGRHREKLTKMRRE